jgi:2-oxoglutarate ferredoxin oxidoreductase subunit delta
VIAVRGGKYVGRVVVDETRCKGCKLCIEFCPKGLLELSDKTNDKGYHVVRQINSEECNGCTLCAIMCPDVALTVYK